MKYYRKALAVTASAALTAIAFAGQANADADKTDDGVTVGIFGKKLHVQQASIFTGGPHFNVCLNGFLTFTPPHGPSGTYTVYHHAGEPCSNSQGAYFLAEDTWWPNNTTACAYFLRVSNNKRYGGKPCVTIHN
ncbi:hypothetical protein [Streptomyces avermitilis]|uniref:hypothetical protein n=1 Tax=Streptomyces avermitilis TaxID=33903 RepID=UPI0037FB46F8